MRKIDHLANTSDLPMKRSMAMQLWYNQNLRFQALAFLLLFFTALLLSWYLDVKTFWYDANGYWVMGDETLASGKFHLLDFKEVRRGCLFPLLLLGFKKIFCGVWGWRVLSALMVSFIFSVLLPIVFNISFSRGTLLRAFAAELFFFYVWGDFAQHPLADLPAAFFCMAAICVCIKLQKNYSNDFVHYILWFRRILLCCLAGIFFYAAYNTRIIYLYSIIIALTFYFFTERRKIVIIPLLSILLGISFASIPQCMINHKYHGSYSAKVDTTYSGIDLRTQQLFWGVTYPKYETYIGETNKYPIPSVYFDDRVGWAMLKRESLTLDSFSLRSITHLFVKYPLDMIGIYTRHLIAIMTPAWNETYISNLQTNKVFLVLSSIGVWLIAGLYLSLTSWRSANLKHITGYLVAIVVPCLMQTLGATEIRYFLPCYLLLYGLVFFKVAYRDLFANVMANKFKIAAILFIIAILWISLFGTILAMNRVQVMLISDYALPSH